MIVVVAVSERNVPINDAFNTQPLAGKHAIFAKVATTTEIRPEIEIVGVYSTLEKAAAGRQAFEANHPGRKYIQKIAPLDGVENMPEPARCIMCGIETGGHSYCEPCRIEHFRQQREADPDLLAEIAAAR